MKQSKTSIAKAMLIEKIKDLQLTEDGHDYIEEVGVGYYSPTFDKVVLEDDELDGRSVKELTNIYDDLKTNYSY